MFNRIRTMRKRWFILAGVSALLIVALALGIAVKADHRSDRIAAGKYSGYGFDHPRYGFEHSRGPFARIGGWFGVEQPDPAEQADARFTSYTGLLAANGTLTQEQADEANAWFLGRPADTDGVAAAMAGAASPQRTTATLARLVSAERITQAQAESIAAWQTQRPDFLANPAGHDTDDYIGGKQGGFRGGPGKERGRH